MKALRNNKIKIFLTVLLVYLFYTSPAYLTANTNRFIVLTKSIVEDQTYRIDKYQHTTRDVAIYNGHYYAGAAPGLGLLAVPVYAISRPLLNLVPKTIYQEIEFNMLNLLFTFFLSILPGAFLAVLLYDLLQDFNLKEKERILLVFASSFGTLLFFYATKFMAHVMGAFLVFSAFYILFKLKRRKLQKKYLYFIAGLLLGTAVLLEYTNIIGASIFTLYAFLNFKKEKISHYVLLVLGLLVTVLIFMHYHYTCFGNPFTHAVTYSRVGGYVPLSLPRLKFIFEFTFGTYRGIFLFMPILLISMYGFFVFFRNPDKKYLQEMTLIALLFVGIFFPTCMLANVSWPWGGSFGPRHFIGVIPFLFIPIAFAYKKIKYRTMLWIALLSIFVNWCGIQYGDSDNVFTNIGLFIFRGLNSNLAEWTYELTNTYVRKLNVITHFSPLIGFIALLIVVYLIWKNEISTAVQAYFCGNNKRAAGAA